MIIIWRNGYKLNQPVYGLVNVINYTAPPSGVTPTPPTPTPTPTPTPAGGFISGSPASNAGKARGLFTGIYRPTKRIERERQEKLSRKQKKLLKAKEASKPRAQKPFDRAPSLQSVADAKTIALQMRAMDEEKRIALQAAGLDIIKLEASQKALAILQAQQLLQMQQDELALILILDDL